MSDLKNRNKKNKTVSNKTEKMNLKYIFYRLIYVLGFTLSPLAILIHVVMYVPFYILFGTDEYNSAKIDLIQLYIDLIKKFDV